MAQPPFGTSLALPYKAPPKREQPRTPEEVDATLDVLVANQEALLKGVETANRTAAQAHRLLMGISTRLQADETARKNRDDALYKIIGDLMGKMGDAGLI